MLCFKCGAKNNDGSNFCIKCGNNIKMEQFQQNNFTNVAPIQNEQSVDQLTNQHPMYNQTKNNYQKPNNNKKSILLPVIIVVIFVIVAVFGAIKLMKKDLPKNNEGDNQQIQENTNVIYDKNGAFLMSIEDVFTIAGKGTVVTGLIERGTINLNDEIQIIGLDKTIITTKAIGIETSRKQLDSAEMGNNVGILLEGVQRHEVKRGQVLAKPNSIKAAKKFIANVSLLSKEEGGLETPITSNYNTNLYFRTIDITGVITLQKGVSKVNPGDKNVKITVELKNNVAMEVGTKFAIRENGKTIGSGTVIKVY